MRPKNNVLNSVQSLLFSRQNRRRKQKSTKEAIKQPIYAKKNCLYAEYVFIDSIYVE